MPSISKEKEALLTQEMLKELLHYDPETGIFTWRTSGRGRRKSGMAGVLRADGYRNITIAGRVILSHRLAWLYMTGKWPKHYIDHINGVKGDNRWVNLREANLKENGRNRVGRKNTSSRYKGVFRCSENLAWIAQLRGGGSRGYLGRFTCEHEAALAYNQAAEKHHGVFAFFNQVYNKFDVEVGPDD
jgi:hypothetical protein